MTKDEAIDRVYDIGKALNVTGTAGERMAAAMALVEGLAALGVLKLDDGAVRSETIDRAIEMIGGIADRVAAGEPATTAFVKEWCKKQNCQKYLIARDLAAAHETARRLDWTVVKRSGQWVTPSGEPIGYLTNFTGIGPAEIYLGIGWQEGPCGAEKLKTSAGAAYYGIVVHDVSAPRFAAEPYMQPETKALIRCEPPPEHREKRWHWLRQTKSGTDNPMACQWLGIGWSYHGEIITAESGFIYGWRYVAPCEEPEPTSPLNQHAKGEPS